jgi:hypothetical protein
MPTGTGRPDRWTGRTAAPARTGPTGRCLPQPARRPRQCWTATARGIGAVTRFVVAVTADTVAIGAGMGASTQR